jgi:hypothetical protein
MYWLFFFFFFFLQICGYYTLKAEQTSSNMESRRMRWVGHVARMREKRNVYMLLVGKPEGKRPLGRPRRRWVDNIRLDLGEVGWGDVDWIDLAPDRNRWRALVNSILNLWVP